jgi:small conductance mechanosensitive channel
VWWQTALDWFVGTPLKIVVILVAALIATRVVRKVIRVTVQRLRDQGSNIGGRLIPGQVTDPRLNARLTTVEALLRNVATVAIWTVAWLLVLGAVGVNLAPLLAGAGVAGIAVGFGAQALVRDVIAGFFMLVEDQFGVGDEIELLGSVGTPIAGVVEGVTLRATQVRGVDGILWTVANGEVRRVGNRSQAWARALLDVRIRLDADPDAAEQVVLDAARAVVATEAIAPLVQGEPELWGVETVGTQWKTLRVAQRTQPESRIPVLRALRLGVNEAVRAAGLHPGSGPDVVVGEVPADETHGLDPDT